MSSLPQSVSPSFSSLSNRFNFPSVASLSHLPVRTGLQRLGRNAPLKILVCEANKVQQEIILTYLMTLGFNHCDAAGNIYEALECVKKTDYDLVFVDFHLPSRANESDPTRCAGVLVRFLRTISAIRPMVVAMSENYDHQIDCLRMGFDHYRLKPLSLEEILALCVARASARQSQSLTQARVRALSFSVCSHEQSTLRNSPF